MNETEEPPLTELDRHGSDRHSNRGNDYPLEFLCGHFIREGRAFPFLLGMLDHRDNSDLDNKCLRLAGRLADL